MKGKCIFCEKKIESNDVILTITVNLERLNREQITETLANNDICGSCYEDLRCGRITRVLKEHNK